MIKYLTFNKKWFIVNLTKVGDHNKPKGEKEMKTDFKLKKESGIFDRGNGEKIEYNNYYILVNGIKAFLKPNDKTSKQLLELLDFEK